MDPQELKYDTNQDQPHPTFKSHVVDFIQTLVVFLAIGTFIYWQVARPHKVSGRSMVPTFQDGDFIITEQITYKLNEPNRGDIVVFKNPREESKDFIKRIIGKPGDRVRLSNGRFFINGRLLKEPYLDPNLTTPGGSFLQEGQTITVPSGQFFAAGDNRYNSTDSREIGPISDKNLRGRVILRYWPPTAFGFMPGGYQFPEDKKK